MEEMSYEVIKEMLVEDYNKVIEIESYSIKQAIAELLEDSVNMMKKNKDNYVSVIVGLAKISLENNVIPNYILERFIDLSENIIEFYKYKDSPVFINDRTYVNVKLKEKHFDVIDDEYKKRVDMLLEGN